MGHSSALGAIGNGSTVAHTTAVVHEAVPAPATGIRSGVPATSRVSLVIPVRNEARNVAWVLEQITADVDEIILVDGASTDATLITALRYRPDIKVVPQQGVGKGSALRTGFFAATGDLIVMMDADGSMAPQEIRHYIHFLRNGYDFVKGSRFIGGGGSLDITPFRKLGNRFLLAVFNSLYDSDLTDLRKAATPCAALRGAARRGAARRALPCWARSPSNVGGGLSRVVLRRS